MRMRKLMLPTVVAGAANCIDYNGILRTSRLRHPQHSFRSKLTQTISKHGPSAQVLQSAAVLESGRPPSCRSGPARDARSCASQARRALQPS